MLLIALLVASFAPGDGKTMAMDDWHVLSVTEVSSSASDGAPYYLRVAAGDLDGDGRRDDAILKLLCLDGALTSAAIQVIKSPRDSASGMPTGKRQHSPVKFVKEWGAATPELRAMKPSYDVKKMEGARVDADSWRPVSLSGSVGLCPATAAAAAIVKSKSNITNN